MTSFLVSFSTFALFALTSDKPLTSQIVFPAIALFQLLQFPLSVLPMVFSSWIEAYVSIQRLTTFLSAKELQRDAVKREPFTGKPKPGDELVSVSDANFSWAAAQTEPTLVNINLSLKRGELVAIVGQVGSGKSSLLSGRSISSSCQALALISTSSHLGRDDEIYWSSHHSRLCSLCLPEPVAARSSSKSKPEHGAWLTIST